MIAGEILRATIHYSIPGTSAVQNVLHYINSGATEDDETVMTELQQYLITEVLEAFWEGIAAQTATATELTGEIVSVDGTVTRNMPTRALDVVGTVAGDVQAAAVSGLIQLETTIPKARGLKYIPGLDEARTSGGLYTAAAVTALTDIGFALVQEVIAGDAKLNLGVNSHTLLAFIPFLISSTAKDDPAYQRRRKRGRGQ